MRPKRRRDYLGAAGRALLFFGGLASLILGLLPLPFLVFNMGALTFLAVGILSVGVAVFWNRFDGWGRVPRRLHEVSDLRRPPVPRWWRRARRIIAVCLVLAAAGGAGISAVMFSAIQNAPGEEATVIVLGCKVYGAQPSLMLQRRLNAALEYLRSHPGAPVVCSGGRDEKDPYSEAAVMAQYLLENGVERERIFLEDASTNTAENLAFSAAVIRGAGLPEQVALATDGFHELRSQIYARRNGLDGRALPARTPWGIAPSYWVREWLAIAKALVLR